MSPLIQTAQPRLPPLCIMFYLSLITVFNLLETPSAINTLNCWPQNWFQRFSQDRACAKQNRRLIPCISRHHSCLCITGRSLPFPSASVADTSWGCCKHRKVQAVSITVCVGTAAYGSRPPPRASSLSLPHLRSFSHSSLRRYQLLSRSDTTCRFVVTNLISKLNRHKRWYLL